MKEVRAEQHTMNQKYYHSDIKLILVNSFGFVSLKNLWFVWSFFEWLHLFLVVVSDFVVKIKPYFGELIFTPLRKPTLNIS